MIIDSLIDLPDSFFRRWYPGLAAVDINRPRNGMIGEIFEKNRYQPGFFPKNGIIIAQTFVAAPFFY